MFIDYIYSKVITTDRFYYLFTAYKPKRLTILLATVCLVMHSDGVEFNYYCKINNKKKIDVVQKVVSQHIASTQDTSFDTMSKQNSNV